MIIKPAKREGEKTVDHGLEVGFRKENKAGFFMSFPLQWEFSAALMRACNAWVSFAEFKCVSEV